MSHDHDHPHDEHEHRAQPPAADAPADAGSQALAEALRSSFVIVKFIMAALVFVFIASGVFTVPPQNVAVKLRFGKPVGTGDEQLLRPGLHWSFPYPVDEVRQIPVAEIQTVTSTAGWYAVTPAQELARAEPPPGESLNPAVDGFTLTADGNIMHVRATLRYRIQNAADYVFNFASATNLAQNALNNALFFASARFPVDRALRHDRAGFKEAVEQQLRKLIRAQALGISVELVEITAVPPRQVRDAFNAVTEAEQDLSKAINAAQGYTNQLLTRAQGEAAAIVNEGQSERVRLLQTVQADAKSFAEQLPLYQKNPNLFQQRRLNDTMARVLANAQEKWFVPERADGQPRELRLLLNPEPVAPKPAEKPTP
ncbi:MAG: protease modulator HflK [Verrucomicrobia bacterium]|nr:protease modulator HflK [Verrucomicrobiota bacterium]